MKQILFQIQGGGMGVPWAAFCTTPRSRHQIEIHPPCAFIHPAQNKGVTPPFDCDSVIMFSEARSSNERNSFNPTFIELTEWQKWVVFGFVKTDYLL